MSASPIRKLAPLADAAKKRGVKVYHLNIGQPDIETPEAIRRRLKTLDERVIEYSPSCGTQEYVAAVATYYAGLGISLQPNEIVSTTGASEAIQFAMLATCDFGDEVIIPEPFYTNYGAFAKMAGAKIVPVTTHAENGFHLPGREAWEKALSPRTRMVILCNPSNPTGAVYSEDELRVVADFCRDHGLFLLADEVYREFVYDGGHVTSLLQLPGYEEITIVADSTSKRYSACGLRLGCLITRNRDLYAAVEKMAQARLSAPGIAQRIAAGLVDLEPGYHEGVIAEYQKRRDVLYEGLLTIPGLVLQKPEGAFYFVARLPIESADDFAAWLLREFQLDNRTVMITPARDFYATPGLGENEARIAYVLNVDALRDAVRVLKAGIAEYAGVKAGR